MLIQAKMEVCEEGEGERVLEGGKVGRTFCDGAVYRRYGGADDSGSVLSWPLVQTLQAFFR